MYINILTLIMYRLEPSGMSRELQEPYTSVAINPSESIFSKPQCDIVILFNDTDEERNAKVMVFHYVHGVFQFLARFRLSLYDEVENGHKLSLGL